MDRITLPTAPPDALVVLSGQADGDLRWDPQNTGNYGAFLTALGLATPPVVARQVHGAEILDIKGPISMAIPDFAAERPAADALVTAVPGIVLGVTVADCVPVYLMDTRRRVIGLVHAGREGTMLDIAGRTARYMAAEYGCAPEDLVAAIGPSAGPCCYEVDPARAAAFADLGLPLRGARHLDLWAANSQQLAASGIGTDRVGICRKCTICGAGFYSYRRGDALARNLALFTVLSR